MKLFKRWAHVLAAAFAALLMTAAGPALAATYVDTGLSDLKPEDKIAVASPQPVQLLFTFKTKGAANARATAQLKKQVTDLVVASGLFSEVSEAPTANGAILSVTIDNIPQEGAAQSGFVTGLTFGLKGSIVSDFYVCTVEYIGGADAAKLTKTGKHALHTTIGLKDAPPNGVKAKNIMAAVTTMVDQIVSNTLNDLAKDTAFNPNAPAPVLAAPAAPATPDAAAPAAVEVPVAAPAAAAEPVKVG